MTRKRFQRISPMLRRGRSSASPLVRSLATTTADSVQLEHQAHPPAGEPSHEWPDRARSAEVVKTLYMINTDMQPLVRPNVATKNAAARPVALRRPRTGERGVRPWQEHRATSTPSTPATTRKHGTLAATCRLGFQTRLAEQDVAVTRSRIRCSSSRPRVAGGPVRVTRPPRLHYFAGLFALMIAEWIPSATC
jgi:hypothetical protein